MALIGLDVGTTGAKAVLFAENGRMISSAFKEYGIDTGPGGKAEQDAESVWQAAREVLVTAARKGAGQSVKAIGISVQGDAVIPVDTAGTAIGPALLGMDYRSAAAAAKCAELLGDRALFERTGMRPHAMNSLAKMVYLKESTPQLYAEADGLVTYAEFIIEKLGGERLIDYTMASRTMAFDLKTHAWAADILAACGIDITKLSRAVPSGTVAGTLAPSLAAETGIVPGTLLVTGGHDQPCGALGAGVTGDGKGIVSTGTAEVFASAFNTIRTGDGMYSGFYPCTIHTLPDLFFTFALNHVGGLLFRWFKESFCAAETAEAQKAGLDPYSYLISRMSTTPRPLFVLPHFNGSGTPWCDMESRGAFIGMDLTTGIPELTRALLESQTYELALNLEALEKAGISTSSLTAAGGGARSPAWLQIKADILDRPVRTLVCREAACLGAAILAGSAAGVWDSPAEGAAAVVHHDKEYLPDPQRAARYAELLAEYREIYPALIPVHRRLY